jgi:hypothetical protein
LVYIVKKWRDSSPAILPLYYCPTKMAEEEGDRHQKNRPLSLS